MANKSKSKGVSLWLILTCCGCDLHNPQGPESPWERPEQQRLAALEEKCGGLPWASAGVICPDDVVIITRADSTGPGT